MGMFSLMIMLQSSSIDTRGVTYSEFVEPLKLVPEDPIESTEYADAPTDRYRAANVIFPIIRLSAFDHAAEPYEAFGAAVQELLASITQFLDQRPTHVFDNLRDRGLKLRIFIEPRIDQDQMEFAFPVDFLAACARQKLGVYLITNDISAAEAIAAGAT